MAGPEQYSLVEISEEGTLIKSTKIPCEIRVRTLLSSWFIAEKLLSHLAVDCDNVIIRSTSTRQPFTSSGLDARTGLFALFESGTQHGPLIKDIFLLCLSKEVPKVLNERANFITPIGREGLRHLSWVEYSEQAAGFLSTI